MPANYETEWSQQLIELIDVDVQATLTFRPAINVVGPNKPRSRSAPMPGYLRTALKIACLMCGKAIAGSDKVGWPHSEHICAIAFIGSSRMDLSSARS